MSSELDPAPDGGASGDSGSASQGDGASPDGGDSGQRASAHGDSASTHGVASGSAELAEHGGALAARATSSDLAQVYPSGAANPFLTGGAGLFDHSEADAVSPATGMWLGVTSLVLAVVLGGFLVAFNPAFASGKAGGTPNQLGPPPAAAAGPAVAPGSPAEEGMHLIAAKPCIGCHVIPGVPGATGTVGPNLTGVASKAKIAGGAVDNKGVDDLKAWVLNPSAKKPGTLMPNVGLTDDEAAKVAAYLETLK